jgi:hypothetical protein
MRYLLDADIVNYVLKGVEPVPQRFREALVDDAEFVLSPVVHYQLLRYLRLKGATRMEQRYLQLVASWLPAELDQGD